MYWLRLTSKPVILRNSSRKLFNFAQLTTSSIHRLKNIFNIQFHHSACQMEKDGEQKVLVALDFDHTIIDNNSDTHIYKLAPDQKIPDNLKSLYRKEGWTHYMGEIFKLLHKNGITEDTLLKCLTEIELTAGMRDLLTGLPRASTEFIIISDSNSIFIDHILKNIGLRDLFSEIYTNPAQFNDAGCLQIQMYHHQDWCSLSTENLCKGSILADYVRKRAEANITFSAVAYVGDGTNDLCPSLRLKGCDFVFPRSGYNLIKYIPKMEDEKGLKVEADICPWSSGKDILERLLPQYERAKNASVPKPRLRLPV